MDRRAAINETSGYFDTQLPDQESLLIQLGDHLYRSGFVFNDAKSSEIEDGNWVIRDFFEQEAEMVRGSVPRDRFDSYVAYTQKFNWKDKLLQSKLRQRILKSFDQLAKGSHHHFNIRYNISKGIRAQEAHPLFDFLLYIEAYYTLALGGKNQEPEEEAEPDISQSNFSIEDILKLRKAAKERLEGREFVNGFLSFIAKDQGVSVENLIPKEKSLERTKQPIKFIRPSKGVPIPEKIATPEPINKPNVVAEDAVVDIEKNANDSSINDDEGALLGFSLEPDLSMMEDDPVDTSATTETTVTSSNTPPDSTNIVEPESEPEPAKEVAKAVSAADLLADMDDHDDDDDFDDDDDLGGMVQIEMDETDVVYGTGQITPKSMSAFVLQFPDSTLKFILRRNLDGRPLPAEIEEVHTGWEDRGLLRPRVKKHVFKIMAWKEVPDIPIHELLQELRLKLFDIKNK